MHLQIRRRHGEDHRVTATHSLVDVGSKLDARYIKTHT